MDFCLFFFGCARGEEGREALRYALSICLSHLVGARHKHHKREYIGEGRPYEAHRVVVGVCFVL